MLVRMIACRAFFGRCRALIDITTYLTLPQYRFVALPHGTIFYTATHGLETVFMMILYSGDCPETFCNLGETFVIGNFGGIGIEFHAFHLFFMSRNREIVDCLSDYTGVHSDVWSHAISLGKVTQINLGVTQFIGSRLSEYIGILEIIFLLGGVGKECITRNGTRLCHIGYSKIGFGLGSP